LDFQAKLADESRGAPEPTKGAGLRVSSAVANTVASSRTNRIQATAVVEEWESF
jgi:hypothetical protein